MRQQNKTNQPFSIGIYKSAKKAISGLRQQFLEHVTAFICWRYIAGFLKTLSMKITAVSLKLGQTRIFISPMSPKIAEKRETGKGSESERKND